MHIQNSVTKICKGTGNCENLIVFLIVYNDLVDPELHRVSFGFDVSIFGSNSVVQLLELESFVSALCDQN